MNTEKMDTDSSAARTVALTGKPAHRPGGGAHKLSSAQRGLYWREWAVLRSQLNCAGWNAAECEEERKRLTTETLGCDKSTTTFTNKDLDAMLDAFRLHSRGEIAVETGTRRRLVHALKKLAGGRESYIAAICRDCFGHENWQRLEEGDLQKLRATLARRVERRHAPAPAAPVSCPPPPPCTPSH